MAYDISYIISSIVYRDYYLHVCSILNLYYHCSARVVAFLPFSSFKCCEKVLKFFTFLSNKCQYEKNIISKVVSQLRSNYLSNM